MNKSCDNEVRELKKWESVKILPKKDSDEENITYLVYFSSCSPIYSTHVSMTTQNYVRIPEISCSFLGLHTDWVCPL